MKVKKETMERYIRMHERPDCEIKRCWVCDRIRRYRKALRELKGKR